MPQHKATNKKASNVECVKYPTCTHPARQAKISLSNKTATWKLRNAEGRCANEAKVEHAEANDETNAMQTLARGGDIEAM